LARGELQFARDEGNDVLLGHRCDGSYVVTSPTRAPKILLSSSRAQRLRIPVQHGIGVAHRRSPSRCSRVVMPPRLDSPAAQRVAHSLDDAGPLLDAMRALRAQVAQRIVGQDHVVEELLLAIVAGGHARLVGVPGLAKTLLVKSLSEAMHLDFRRIQFTPDLVPSDITGTEILE